MIPIASKLALSIAAAVLAGAAWANPIHFDESWREQGFLRLWSNDYSFQGGRLKVRSEGTVSLLWRGVESVLGNSDRAHWSWTVEQGVPATDLQTKGGDDRNLAVYFVFVDPETASKLTRGTARRLLQNPSAHALVYVWGGDHETGSVLQSPYHPKLVSYILRPAGVGKFDESVDLKADFLAAFGEAKGVLVGLGISADSDDTDGQIMAWIENFELSNR